MDGPSYLACGRHVFVDISDTNPEVLNDLSSLERALTEAAITEGVTVLGVIRHAFQPSGVTILLLLAESHVSLHTYPEQGKAFFDAFTCGVQFEPANIFHGFARASAVGSYRIVQCERGGRCSET
ncbi:adenosylmethionine decarboxylase [Burkholderia aenigmatica]|uniref:Adenosylmethionine decarboxylase n=1 Tax=Burkholderia aenigmatica TaxID=2015348 RepID=A0A228ICF9_9BURK|nr:adenosylmethionine decarboxylase [Burkholderia aenigmatica]OXI39789.1 adenosylmethionine decarboxylase [Burkholderia aenigmatica]